MNKFPICYFEDNLIFNINGECWAVYKVNTYNYDYENADKKMDILNNLTRFIMNVGNEAKILIVPIKLNYDDHFNMLEESLEKDEIYKTSLEYLNGVKEYINTQYKGTLNDYNVYIMVNLTSNGGENIKDFMSELITNPMEKIYDYFGVTLGEISKRKVKNYKRLAKEFIDKQTRRISIEAVSAYDIQWLIQRMFYRGTENNVDLRKNWNPYVEENDDYIRPMVRDILTLSSGVIDLTEKRILKVDHVDTISYQSFVPLTRIPEIQFPGSEFLKFIQYLYYPVDVCIHINNIDFKKAIRKVERKRREVKAQIEHIERNDEYIPDDLLEAREHADYLEAELKSLSSPLSNVSITFCVYSNNKKDLEDQVRYLREFYKDMNFSTERPIADQGKLFMEFIPGTGRYIKDFVVPMIPKLLAGSMFGTTCHLGDYRGMYIGKGGALQKPVFLDLLYACQLNKPAAAFIEGAQGYGKTFNSNLLVYLHVLNGAKAFIIDPKGDRKHWEEKFPELSHHISTVYFKASEEDQGKLDPFLIHRKNMNEAGQLALNIVCELFNINSGTRQYVILKETIERVKKSDNPSMKMLKNYLEEVPEEDKCKEAAELLARQLNSMDEASLAGLLFGDGSQKELGFDNRINIIMIQDLVLPGRHTIKSDYTYEEKLGTVLMLAVSNFAKNFSQMDNSIKKIIVVDEAWSLVKTQQGENLFERLARTGRSLNTSCIFIGHSSKDLTTEGIRNAIRYKFVFNIGNKEEAYETLDFLGMDVSEENINLIASDEGLKNGECLFSDVEGRIGQLKFDAIYDYIIEAFMTTPPEKRRLSG